MKSVFSSLARMYKKNRDSIVITLIGLFAALLINILINITIPSLSTVSYTANSLIFLGLFMSICLLLYVKHSINIRLSDVNDIIYNFIGFSFYKNEYFARKKHFTVEKELLAEIMVFHELPELIKKIKQDKKKISKLVLLLDSGTTITPIFPKLFKNGIKNFNCKELEIYTNNLAGIDEIHKFDYYGDCVLNESNINIIAGNPLKTYRAITGTISETFIEKNVWEKYKEDQGTIVVSVVTANWLLAGNSLNKLALCARGKGHLRFKETIVKCSHYRFIIAPLTKITKLENTSQLNDISPYKDEYDAYIIPENYHDKTFLLTTFRPEGSLSPLLVHSNFLKSVKDSGSNMNFKFSENIPLYQPDGDAQRVFNIELPHYYIHRHFNDLFCH